ncbi:hypothetical protein N0V87_003004 [Didymella glomerata]|uniref:Amine oxidase n=1 Tax=Didymella glomerata TaxID=749621 RepID=A0A9W9C1V7_9PLEO|nr:hypothetical protein N0V87_003004 [Didymella glomerata]
MGVYYETIPDSLIPWIKKQQMLLVGTAPLASDGHINISPKGGEDFFGVLSPTQFWYMDLTGSGVETHAHLHEPDNGRICVMFMAFTGPPQIVRIWGDGHVLENGSPEYTAFIADHKVKTIPGSRSIIIVDVHQCATSCGFSVPYYDFVAHRPILNEHFEKKERKFKEGDEKEGMDYYWAWKSARSVDGMPGMKRGVEYAEKNGVKPLRKWKEKAIATVAPTAITRRFLEVLTTLSAAAELAQTSIYAFAKSVPLSGGMVTMLSAEGGAQDSLITESVGSVVDMLASRLGSGRLRTDTRVVGIVQTDNGVVVRAQSGEEFRAAKVIVAVPPPMLTSISFQPPLPEERLRLQENTQMGVVYKAIAVFETPFWRDRFGGECIVLDDPPRGIFDSSSPSDKGPGHLCVLVGGSPARMLDGMSPQARIELLLGPLIELLGAEILKPVEWHEKAWHGDEFCGGGYMAMSKINTLEGLMPMPHERIGDVHWAGTETAAEHSGYIEGAIESGQRAAREIVL